MRACAGAQDYVRSNIYMNSVDTGWINEENPAHIAAQNAAERNFATPLDEIDAAARILDPVFVGLQVEVDERKLYTGLFLKDYQLSEW